MQIKLQNIGIIKESTLEINGLTVITGKNDSGKTTVGKALYSVLESINNLDAKALYDKGLYIGKQLDLVRKELKTIWFYDDLNENEKPVFPGYPSLEVLTNAEWRRNITPLEVGSFARKIMHELNVINVSDMMDEEPFLSYAELSFAFSAPEIDSFDTESIVAEIESQIDKAKAILKKTFENISKDSELIEYSKANVNRTLNVEFCRQIQPVRGQEGESFIEIINSENTSFRVDIIDNNVKNVRNQKFSASPFDKIFLIDDPYVLDEERFGRSHSLKEDDDYNPFFNPSRIRNHNQRLKAFLNKDIGVSVFEETLIHESINIIKHKIDAIIPGFFEHSTDGNYYIVDGKKLKVENLAAGAKMFSILKIMLEKGYIDEHTLLILDEPESHLHPQWQNALAEIIVLFVKELDVNVILTTHSPNFMLAIDAYMRKYDVEKKTNFYQTEKDRNGFVRYRCVDDDMELIYRDFLQYLSEVKMLRNTYIQ